VVEPEALDVEHRGGIRVLSICTANECRSPLAAATIQRTWVIDGPVDAPLISTSAGVEALAGSSWCEQSAEVAQADGNGHRSRELQVDDLESATLVLAMDRTQRAIAARLQPSVRPRLFTLVQAALLAEHVGSSLKWNGPADGAPALPSGTSERIQWLVAEMDAARGALAGMGDEALDITDVHAMDDHRAGLERVRTSAQTLTEWMIQVARIYTTVTSVQN